MGKLSGYSFRCLKPSEISLIRRISSIRTNPLMPSAGQRSAVGSAFYSRQTQKSRVRYPFRPHTFVSPSGGSRRASVSYERKYVHLVLAHRLGDLSPEKERLG